MQRTDRPSMVTAAEIACWAYCPEQWRLQYGLDLSPSNDASRSAGVRHHAGKAFAERIAGVVILLGRLLVLVALGLLVLWLVWR